MQSLAISSTMCAAPFIRYVEEYGHDSRKLLWQYGVDYNTLLQLSPHIPSHSLGLIIDSVEHCIGSDSIVDISSRYSNQIDMHPLVRELLLKSQGIVSFLTDVVSVSQHQGSHFQVWAGYEHDEMRIYFSHGVAESNRGFSLIQQFTALRLITLVQHFMGSSWKPEYLAFSSETIPSHHVYSQTQTGQVLRGVSFSFLPVKIGQPEYELPLNALDSNQSDFERVKSVAQSFWRHEDFSVGFLARLFGISERTVQRIFASQGLRFRDFHNQLKYNFTLSQLKRGTTVTDIASSLGYDNPSNLTRLMRNLGS